MSQIVSYYSAQVKDHIITRPARLHRSNRTTDPTQIVMGRTFLNRFYLVLMSFGGVMDSAHGRAEPPLATEAAQHRGQELHSQRVQIADLPWPGPCHL